jgi:hypothetical protein
MAIETTINTNIVKNDQRTYRVTIECPKGADYRIAAFRENLGLDTNGSVVARTEAPSVLRFAMSQLIAGKEPDFVCQDGARISIAYLLETIPGLIDRWAVADAQK